MNANEEHSREHRGGLPLRFQRQRVIRLPCDSAFTLPPQSMHKTQIKQKLHVYEVGVNVCFHIRRTTMNCLLLNLAFADITVVAFFASRFILKHTYNHPDGKLGTILCKLLTGGTFGWIGSCASVFTLVAIAIERYYAVIRPLGNRATFTKDGLKVRFLMSETMIWYDMI